MTITIYSESVLPRFYLCASTSKLPWHCLSTLFRYFKQGVFYREHYLYPYSNGQKICQKPKLLCNQLGWQTQHSWRDRTNVITNIHSWFCPIKENMLALLHTYHEPKGKSNHAENTWNVQSTLKCHSQTITLRDSEYENFI